MQGSSQGLDNVVVHIRMDGTPLDRAYTSAKAADAAVLAGNFAKAAECFKAAADYFEEVFAGTPETASARTLQALAEQHRDLAKYFSSGEAEKDVKKHISSPVSSTYGLPSLDNGATVAANVLSRPSKPNSHYFAAPTALAPALSTISIPPNSSNSLISGVRMPGGTSLSLDEAISALASRSAAVFTRTFDTVVSEKLGNHSGLKQSGTAAPRDSLHPTNSTKSDTNGTNRSVSTFAASDSLNNLQANSLDTNSPSESFYLVKAKSSKPSFAKQSLNALAQARAPKHTDSSPKAGSPSASNQQIGLCNNDRAQAIDRASKAQRETLKTGLQQLIAMVTQHEEQEKNEQLKEIDQIRAENDRLKIQVSKLKSRWEDLKESARKRQTSADP